MERVVAAADRGVRVRILVDDLYLISQAGIRNQDKTFAAVCAHPLIALKLFNPGYFPGRNRRARRQFRRQLLHLQ